MAPDERFSWALSVMDIPPAAHVLEIGCGHGIAVSMIAPLLTTGSITAVDKSAAMIAKAATRNAGNKAALLTGGFADVPLLRQRYDIIFGFNVNIFQKPPGVEMQRIRKLLSPGGLLYVFYQSLPGGNVAGMKGMAEQIQLQLETGGFEIQNIHFKKVGTGSCICLIGKSLLEL
ncbi:hypothetical protein CCY01nite_42370 [Chitinophaga cymbidii]|uniref:Methyltransferase domain-containing protein n=2 Tax=Chitinophaga cymbidii TaxID=1096750 RepID=A0A512RQL3_9BACT|nr:hypothetical protein CCY01nite_42370 [Chitinophaga cymbidii]